jgi:hypothetical protein
MKDNPLRGNEEPSITALGAIDPRPHDTARRA